MRYLIILTMIALVLSCNQDKSEKPKKDVAAQDTIINKVPAKPDSTSIKMDKESALISLSLKVLNSLKNRDYQDLVTFIDTTRGLRFSPYASVDIVNDQLLSKEKILELGESQQRIEWGSYDASGEPIRLPIAKYFGSFVYDEDFLNAEKRSVNKFIGGGNSLNNLESIYPGCDFTEFYFSGFDPKMEGMDWKSVRLVFTRDNDKTWLVAVIHDKWTM